MVESEVPIEELESLYRRRYGAFVRVASAIAGEPARGADAVHDAFANAIAAWHPGSFERGDYVISQDGKVMEAGWFVFGGGNQYSNLTLTDTGGQRSAPTPGCPASTS